MSLTGSALLWTLTVCTVALFVWTVIAWPRSAGPGVRAILCRIGYQLGIVALALFTVGVALNDQYDWYANWADLSTILASGAPESALFTAGAPATAAAQTPTSRPLHGKDGGSPLPHRRPVSAFPDSVGQLGLTTAPGPDGQYHAYTVGGGVSGFTGSITVWFPQAYTDPGESRRHFPVLEAFHGVPGSPAQIVTGFQLGPKMAAEVAGGHIADTVLVLPNIAPRQLDTECVDGTAGQPRMETWLTADVTDWISTHLRVQTGRGSWATLGLSAGAYCASMLTMLHPDLFSAAISLGGYYQPTFQPSFVPFPPGSAQASRHDLVRLTRDNPPPVALWVQTSKSDPVSYDTTQKLLRYARPPLSVTADILQNAGHRLGVWAPLIPQTLQWLGSSAPGFRPTTPRG